MLSPSKHFLRLSGFYPPFSYSTASSLSLSLSFCPSVSSVVPHRVFLISGLSRRVGDVDVFFLQSNAIPTLRVPVYSGTLPTLMQ